MYVSMSGVGAGSAHATVVDACFSGVVYNIVGFSYVSMFESESGIIAGAAQPELSFVMRGEEEVDRVLVTDAVLKSDVFAWSFQKLSP